MSTHLVLRHYYHSPCFAGEEPETQKDERVWQRSQDSQEVELVCRSRQAALKACVFNLTPRNLLELPGLGLES
jgi:hypothetical protein